MEEVLIIDDSRQIASFLADTVLPEYGYGSRVVHTGWEGLAFLKQRLPDLVLLDLQLPDASGLDILRQINEHKYDIPVILMTAHGSEQTAVEAFRLGARNYLIKPFDAGEAGEAIDRALRERRLKRETEILNRHLEQRLQELTILSSVGKSVTALLDLEELLERIVEAGVYLTKADEGSLLLRDGEDLYLRAAVSEEGVKRYRVHMRDSIAGEVVRSGKPVRIDRSQTSEDIKVRTGFLAHAVLQVPISVGRRAIGVLGVANRQTLRSFNENDQYLLSAIADYAAIAIENSRLFISTRDSERRYRELFDNANDMIFTLDPRLNITSINRQGIKSLGYPVAELMGKPLHVLCIADEQQDDVEEQLQRQLSRAASEGVTFPLQLQRLNGEEMHAEVSAQLTYQNERISGLHCIARDVTERRRLELQLLQAEKLSAIGQLVAGVAHELNNPMTSIKGFTELLLRRTDLDEEARQDLSYINSQAERAGRIVTNLLTFAREHQPQRTLVDINKVIEDTLSLHTYHLRVDNIRVVRELTQDLPNSVADPYQLQQVFLNLIGNAHHAMAEQGGGVLTVHTECINNEIRARISDTGPGIAQHLLGRIFDPFFTTKPVGKGTGLGLSICFNILQDHGGTIWVDSDAEGTVFTVVMPIATSEVIPTQSDDTPVSVTVPAGHMLVVDDEEGVSEVIQRLLRDMGHDVTAASSGQEALEILAKRSFSLILTDIKMPGINGFQLYRTIEQRFPELASRVIFVTGDTLSPSTELKLRQIGNPVLPKPFSSRKLEQMVNEFLAAHPIAEPSALESS